MGNNFNLKLYFTLCATAFASANEVQVFFNRTDNNSYIDPYRNIERSGENIEDEMIQVIQSAQQRIWMAAYELRLPRVARALKAAHENGVDVKIVTENQNNYLMSELGTLIPDASDYEVGRLNDYFAYTDLNQNNILEDAEIIEMDALKIVKDAGIPLVDDTEDGSKGSGLMHHKFLVVDNNVVFTGSGNFTWSDLHGDKLQNASRGNANNFLKFENETINKIFADEFLMMWGDGPGALKNSRFGVKKPYRAPTTISLNDGTQVTIQFGATSKSYGFEGSPNGLIAQYLSQATVSLEASLFVWSEQKLSDVISQKIAKNVSILIDSFFAYRPYSELLDVLGVEMLGQNCKIEADNNAWGNPSSTSGTVKLSPGDLLHHKFGIIDSNTVITGSHNWSANANQNNDEVVIVLESNKIAALYHEEFQRIKRHSSLGVTPYLLSKIEEEKQRCSTLAP